MKQIVITIHRINQKQSANGLDRFSLVQRGLLGASVVMLYFDEGTAEFDTDDDNNIMAVRGVRNGKSIELKVGDTAVGLLMDNGGYRFATSDVNAAVNELNGLSLSSRAQIAHSRALKAAALEDEL